MPGLPDTWQHRKYDRKGEDMGFNIAIDGPAGAGKSTIAKLVAARQNCIYVDTGAMYRGLAVHFLGKQIDPSDINAVIDACRDADVSIRYEDGMQQVYLNGTNITGQLRREEVGDMASKTSAIPEVRTKLLELQRTMARERRFDDLQAKGQECDLTKIQEDIRARDHRDMTRETAPLKQADDAVLVDSSDMNIEEVTDAILAICADKQKETV